MISLLLHETEAEPRSSVITMISSEYTGYNWLMSHIQSKSVTVEPRLSNSYLSVPLIIRNDVQKQVIPNC